MKKRLISVLAVLAMLVAMLPTAAFAADTDTDSSKTLTVGSGQTYTTVQQAINAIYGEEDPTDWTIELLSGTYLQFAIPKQLEGLTVKPADGASVTISTWTGEVDEVFNSSYYNFQGAELGYCGVYVQAQNVTFSGLNFTLGTYSSDTWYRACITDFGGYAGGGTMSTGMTVTNCNFTSEEQGYTTTYPTGTTYPSFGILVCASTSWTVTNCTFSNFASAISFMCDGYYLTGDGINVTNNTFTSCDRALDGYYGGTPDGIAATLTFSNNIVTGSSTLRSKVVVMDQVSAGSIGAVSITNNTFSYTMVLMENMAESSCTVNDVLADNTFSDGSYYAEGDGWYYNGSYNGSITVSLPDAAYYEAPEGDTGYWVLNVDLDSLGSNTEGATEAVQAIIDAANEAGSHTLSITWDDTDEATLLYTVTAFKDCIYWVSGTMPTSKEDLPGLDKTIVTEDGEVDKDDVAAGDTVDYKLTSNVPSTLDEYIDYSAAEGSDNTNVIPLGEVGTDEDGETYTYTLTFHDKMDSALSYDGNAKVTLVTYELDKDGNVTTTVKGTTDVTNYATITTSNLTDGCTFEVSIDLLALYTAGLITEDDFGSAEIIVTFSATLSEGATAGAYYNTAWVVYPNGESEKDTVEVDTYKLSVFKYDQDDESGLAGAVFTVTYPDDSTKELTSDEDGYATLDGLDAGTYTIQETTAPEGYVKADTILTVVIPAEVTDYVASVRFANAGIPSTGGAGTTMYTVVGICIILAAGLALVVTRKTRRAE